MDIARSVFTIQKAQGQGLLFWMPSSGTSHGEVLSGTPPKMSPGNMREGLQQFVCNAAICSGLELESSTFPRRVILARMVPSQPQMRESHPCVVDRNEASGTGPNITAVQLMISSCAGDALIPAHKCWPLR